MKKVLIVDNSSYMRMFIKKVAQKGGFDTIFEASGSEDAIELFESENPEIVILDLNMSEARMDGITVLTNIMEVNPEAAVIISSAVRHDYVKDECLELGAKEYINKPFDTKDLLEKLEKYK